MRILVFEYVCGGGLAGGALPAALAAEGRMMLQTLLAELKSLPNIGLLVPLDWRHAGWQLPDSASRFVVGPEQDVMRLLPALLAQCDAIWPIAPETGGLLTAIATQAQQAGKLLLASSPAAIACCADKLATHDVLQAHGLPVVATFALARWRQTGCHYVIKPRDGAGCEHSLLVRDAAGGSLAAERLRQPAGWIAQPYHPGRAVSLSCLFRHGEAALLCCNRQHVDIVADGFVLNACEVNVVSPWQAFYQELVARIARALPELWGYIGIDLLETPQHGPLLLEINPRLTTSYAGVGMAMGCNVAGLVLELLSGPPGQARPAGGSVMVRIQEIAE